MKENQNIEWKESWRDEYLKWICGFANGQGGAIYIGKNDNGKIVGIDNSKRLMDDLPNKIQTNLGIVCDVNLHTENEKEYIEIITRPYNVAISYKGVYHYRSGSTKQELKGNTLNDFLLKRTGKTWGDLIEPEASLDDIDIKALETFKKGAVKSKRFQQVENENDIMAIFNNLKLSKNGQLKNSALLLFGKDPRDFFLHAYVKIGRFGDSDDELLSQEVVEGNAFELADNVLEILDKKYFKKTITYEGLHRVETPEYPYEALREAILNAIVHRQYLGGTPITISIYDNKVMIWSYGKLSDEITFDDLKKKHGSYPRNPHLADVFFKGGLIETWGRGTLKIINECKLAGLPEPEISEMTGGIAVTLFKSELTEEKLKLKGLSSRQIKAIFYIKEKGKITNGEYQKLCSVSKATATRDLTELIELFKLIERSGSVGAGTVYKLIGS